MSSDDTQFKNTPLLQNNTEEVNIIQNQQKFQQQSGQQQTQNIKQTTPFVAALTVINVMLATGPLIVPFAFLESGIGLGIIFCLIIGFFSYMAVEYVVESMSIANALTYIKFQEIEMSQKSMSVNEDEVKNSDITETGKRKIQEKIIEQGQQLFDFQTIIEYGSQGMAIIGEKGKLFNTIILMMYLIGLLISKCIMAGNNLSEGFEGIAVLDNYYFWLILFFCCSAVLSFQDVASIKIVQIFIAAIRCLCILSLFIGCFQVMGQDGTHSLTPTYVNGDYTHKFNAFDFKYFGNLFSNVVFAMLMHHSTPSIVTPVNDKKKIKNVFYMSFSFGILILTLLPIIGIIAFGPGLCDPQKPNDMIYFQYNFKDKANWVYYFVTFYFFLNIAAFPVVTITLRNNLMKLFTPQFMPKCSFEITKWTLLYTAIILAVVFPASILLKNYIQYVLDFTGGICGVNLMLIIPSFQVIVGRFKLRRYFCGEYKNMHQCVLKQDAITIGIFGISIVLFFYNAYLEFSNWF